jgi:plastocyanin
MMMRSWKTWILVIVAASTATVALLVARDDPAAAPPRAIRLVVRDMAFHVEGEEGRNPVLRLRAGERVRLVIRNEDPGMSHDFAIEPWKVATARVEGDGEEASVTFRVPDRRGSETYTCTPHSRMMRGTILIE